MPAKQHLSPKEKAAEAEFIKSLPHLPPTRPHKPLIVALIGLVGAGKSEVGREIARKTSGIVIEGDAIRGVLRRHKSGYDHVHLIEMHALEYVLAHGGNVVLDGDFVGSVKQLAAKAKSLHAKLEFVRVVADPDVMIGRIINDSRLNDPETFFGGAGSSWKRANRGVVVKLREFWRRTPHHYRWEAKGGGRFVLRKLKYKVFTVDTTDETAWKAQLGTHYKK